MVIGRKMNINDNYVFLNRLHQDCSPNQYVRELTVNAVQSIMRTADKQGDVHQVLKRNINHRLGKSHVNS